ncbi:MAG: PAS domain S-box protein, partial [Candidatus Competibacteraceae bacterium]|nr:PAS domain S-box protein [Candidatus Competibacteraceae bacterium]
GYDRYRNVIFWNTASEQLYGYSQQEVLGRKLEHLLAPDLREDWTDAFERWITDDLPILAGEINMLHKDVHPY